jgi:hypothetical protein
VGDKYLLKGYRKPQLMRNGAFMVLNGPTSFGLKKIIILK